MRFTVPQTFWKQCVEHLARGMMVVVSCPLTELQQATIDQGLRVEQLQRRFEGTLSYVAMGRYGQQIPGNLPSTEGNAPLGHPLSRGRRLGAR